MGEEMNRREAELNEATLENVSGGDMAQLKLYNKAAGIYCQPCDRQGNCGHSAMDLARYILEHGDISSNKNCPFRG